MNREQLFAVFCGVALFAIGFFAVRGEGPSTDSKPTSEEIRKNGEEDGKRRMEASIQELKDATKPGDPDGKIVYFSEDHPPAWSISPQNLEAFVTKQRQEIESLQKRVLRLESFHQTTTAVFSTTSVLVPIKKGGQ